MATSSRNEYEEFKSLLGQDKIDDFLAACDLYPKTADLNFDDFQKLAFKTARTEGPLLRQVCLSVLWQHGAELLRFKLPESERQINRKLAERPISYVLGDIAWHVSAIASFYGLSLDYVISKNVEKIEFRLGRDRPTALHDEEYPIGQKFPRVFDVSFISVGPRRSRMYMNGRSLGDDLTDNSIEDDGYRFHDVMHLANVAKLGWSPVLRDLLKLKRKSDPTVDEVQDGARARIVEEAVIKAIHSEGVRLARQKHIGPLRPDHQDIFPDADDISYGFLKFITSLVANLEVEKNTYWEWEDAILEGYRLFHQLRVHGQGTVHVDLTNRELVFSPDVHPDFAGTVGGIGTSIASVPAGLFDVTTSPEISASVKAAVLRSLELTEQDLSEHDSLEVKMLSESRPSVSASGVVAKRMWSRSIVCFRTSFIQEAGRVVCTALAIADTQ
jgi:hypothetical protein